MPYKDKAKQKTAKKRLDRERKARRRAIVAEYKLEQGCQECGYRKCAEALDFHHRDPTKKEIKIAQLNKSIKVILEELLKCDVLCANCHRELHAKDNIAGGR